MLFAFINGGKYYAVADNISHFRQGGGIYDNCEIFTFWTAHLRLLSL
jgi:hypothetical protein